MPMNRMQRQKLFDVLLFLSPNFILFIAFVFGPMVYALILSFLKWNILSAPVFVGLENFKKLFTDSYFSQAFWNTLYFCFGSIFIRIIIALLIALALTNTRIKGVVIFRTIFFLPYITMAAAIGLVWAWIFNPDFGMLTNLFDHVGITNPNWLGTVELAMPAVIIVAIWKTMGYHMILLIAGLHSISKEYYESAAIDGASSMQQFFKITLPLLTPTMFFVVVISFINSFQVFVEPWIMTQGGPMGATRTLVMGIYENGFQWFKMGYASAFSWVLFVLILFITIFQWRLQKRWVTYER